MQLMCNFLIFTVFITWLLQLVERFGIRKPVNNTSSKAFVTPTDRPKSVRNRNVIDVFGGVFVLAIGCFAVGIRVFVLELSQISFLFSLLTGRTWIQATRFIFYNISHWFVAML